MQEAKGRYAHKLQVDVADWFFARNRAVGYGQRLSTLIPANPPKAALQARMAEANRVLGERRYVHTIPNNAGTNGPQQVKPNSSGYRPDRKSARRRPN